MNRFAALRAGYGTLLLAAPGPVFRLYTGHRADRVTRAVVRILGARHLVQGIVTAGNPGPIVLAVGAQVDLAHVASMLGLAVLDQRRRRAGLVDAAAAGAFAFTGGPGWSGAGHLAPGRERPRRAGRPPAHRGMPDSTTHPAASDLPPTRP